MDDHYKHPADEKKVRFRTNILDTKNENRRWTLLITILSFFLSAALSVASSNVLAAAGVFTSISIVLLIIVINILFDIIGTAVTAADEAPFHAMASRKLYGAKQAIKLIRNADKVSNFCNDVIGDICGIISGTASAFIIVNLSGNNNAADTTLAGLAIGGMVASLTVGGKAAGKSIAIQNSNYIVYKVAVIINFIIGRINIKAKRKKKKKQNRLKEG